MRFSVVRIHVSLKNIFENLLHVGLGLSFSLMVNSIVILKSACKQIQLQDLGRVLPVSSAFDTVTYGSTLLWY